MRETCARSSGCAGEVSRRTELWRDLSWHLGDGWADALCSWIDAQPDPEEASAAVQACLALAASQESGLYYNSTNNIKTALAELCPGVDDCLMAERRAPKRRAQVPMP